MVQVVEDALSTLVGWVRFPTCHTEDLKNGTCGLSNNRRRWVGTRRRFAVHARSWHCLATTAAFTYESSRGAHDESKRRWVPQTTCYTPKGIQIRSISENELKLFQHFDTLMVVALYRHSPLLAKHCTKWKMQKAVSNACSHFAKWIMTI